MIFAGPERVAVDMLALLEATWKETDALGFSVDWFLIKSNKGLEIAFS
jgi:hypothetical protein